MNLDVVENICVVIQSFSEIKGHINPNDSSDSDSDDEPGITFDNLKQTFYKMLTMRINRDIYQKGCQYDFS